MSRLKELRLHGFKSFADQTRFVFEPGVNAVIGPNGSGKSNMADAVRWVLGEQSNRSLRTRRADDVIFAGSEMRRPQGMAEAILTLDNADGWLPIDYAEVSVGRRAYRSGESEYLINGARARLKDVVELLGEGRLGANELVVVGQGTVDSVLSLRPEERRQLFDEAAGVKSLHVKRNEGSSRLAKALDNLARVSDLVGELKPQVRRLALQAEHQQQHDSLGARARGLVTVQHRRRDQAARAALGEARRAAAAGEAALDAFREAQEAGRQSVSEAEAAYWEAEEASRAAATAREETRATVIRAESRLESIDARLREVVSTLDQERAELADSEGAPTSRDDDSLDVEITPALAEAAQAEEGWRSAVAELAMADEALLAAEEAVAWVRSRDSDQIAAAARASEEDARHRMRHEQATKERSATHTALAAATRAQETARQVMDVARDHAVQAKARAERDLLKRDDAQQIADGTRQEAMRISERLAAMRAELDAVAEPHDAASRLGRRLASAGWKTLLDAVDPPEASWAAVEAVVGGELEAALLWADGDPTAEVVGARGAARLLTSGLDVDAGERETALEAVGAQRTLADWIGPTRAPLAFQRTVVAADVAALLRGWRNLPAGWAAVTPAGDLADARGVVVLRGDADPPGGASARSHARRRDLHDAVVTLEREGADANLGAHEAAERLRAMRDAHLASAGAHEEAERAARRSRDELDAADADVKRHMDQLARLDAELTTLAGRERTADPALGTTATEDELARLQAAAGEARTLRDAMARSRDAARERWTATRHAAEEAEARMAGQRQERNLREARMTQLRASIPYRERAVAELSAERGELAEIAGRALAADQQSVAVHAMAEASRTARRADLLEMERAQTGTTAQLAELERAAQSTAIEASRRDEVLNGLGRERELAFEGLPETAATGRLDEFEALDDEEVTADLRRVRRLLSQIGSVNPFAVEEHRELSTRLGEMSSQEQDLRAAITSTEELIARLDSEIGSQFDRAFRAIAERFDEYCQLLFAGGSGSLQMADEADGDAPGGIEIVVRPPGKRLQRLAMLSGGERALTGVALLFAMLTVNPVPFCILDEVDAALDEANIGRFADALRKLSESIDFVVITHNRATIEVADTIYGVTMTDAAVSRLLSLRLADVPAEVTA